MSVSGAGSSGGADESGKHALRAHQAEKEANRRISEAHRSVTEAQKQSAEELDRIKEDYLRQSLAESARHEAQMEANKQKSYRAVRDQQLALQKDVSRSRREGDKTLAEVQGHYRDQIHRVAKTGEEDLQGLQMDQHRQMEFMRRQGAADQDLENKNHVAQMEDLRGLHEQQRTELQDANRKDYEELKSKTELAREQSRVHFQENYNREVSEQDKVLNRIRSNATDEIIRTREDTAYKLAAYQSRQKDPFYQLVSIDASIRETPDEYVLTANIPEHERKGLQISVKGDSLVVSGTRRNEEILEDGRGRSQGTSTYQTFHESFPIEWPVHSKGMTREFNGNELLVRIPKKKAFEISPQFQKKPIERARAERPKFPENLPYQDVAKKEDLAARRGEKPEDSEGAEGTPRKGFRTLG
ncbi:MAG: Hsp20 family protein [Bdellovibrionales bacterium]|nr:Hsp20 family protein [Bdellovibrionales bacterium]